MPLSDLSADAAILLLRLAVVGVLYLFLLTIFFVARRELASQVGGGGVPGQLVLVEAGSTGLPAGQLLPLKRVTTIGRAPECTIVLNDTFVSSVHAVLSWRAGRWWLHDAGSTNGTTWNQALIGPEEVAIQFGDVVGIGGLRLKLAR